MTIQEEFSALKISEEQQDSSEFDAIVVGAGPAGMSAALCLSRAQLSVMLIDRNLPGGETATAYNITNYLGFH
jgi:Thioredoxin reductase